MLRRTARQMAYGRWTWLPCVLWLASACQTGDQTLSVTPVKLASGNFKNLSWGGAQVERFHVVARRVETDDVVIWSADHPKTCKLGSVDWYNTARPMRSGGLAWGALGKGLVPFIAQRDENGIGDLQFAGIDCVSEDIELPGVTPRALFATYDATRANPTFVALDASAHLAFLNPWSGEKIERGTDVTGVYPIGEGAWIIDAGQAVLLDTKGNELSRRLGTNHSVSDLKILSQTSIAYVDDDGLRQYSTESDLDQLVQKDACAPFVPSGFPSSTLAFFWPCTDQRLVVSAPGRPKHVYASGIDNFVSDSGFLIYTRKTDDQTELWVADGDKEAMEIELPAGAGFDLRDAWFHAPKKFLLWVADGDVYGLWELDYAKHSVTPLHDRSGAVADHLKSVRLESTLFATLSDGGELQVWRLSDLSELPSLRRANLANDPRFMFGGSSPALGYITDVNPDTGLGRLELFFVHDGTHRQIETDGADHGRVVREFQEVWWPETGVLYATGGPQPELKFARVDVPCDQTGASPFACAF